MWMMLARSGPAPIWSRVRRKSRHPARVHAPRADHSINEFGWSAVAITKSDDTGGTTSRGCHDTSAQFGARWIQPSGASIWHRGRNLDGERRLVPLQQGCNEIGSGHCMANSHTCTLRCAPDPRFVGAIHIVESITGEDGKIHVGH